MIIEVAYFDGLCRGRVVHNHTRRVESVEVKSVIEGGILARYTPDDLLTQRTPDNSTDRYNLCRYCTREAPGDPPQKKSNSLFTQVRQANEHCHTISPFCDPPPYMGFDEQSLHHLLCRKDDTTKIGTKHDPFHK